MEDKQKKERKTKQEKNRCRKTARKGDRRRNELSPRIRKATGFAEERRTMMEKNRTESVENLVLANLYNPFFSLYFGR